MGSENEERIDHPRHYGYDWAFEPIKVIEAWQLNFSLGSVLKYVYRAGKKNPETHLEDLEKAKWYLQREIERIKRSAA